jgi:hypothetical protein
MRHIPFDPAVSEFLQSHPGVQYDTRATAAIRLAAGEAFDTVKELSFEPPELITGFADYWATEKASLRKKFIEGIHMIAMPGRDFTAPMIIVMAQEVLFKFVEHEVKKFARAVTNVRVECDVRPDGGGQ